VKVAFTYSGLPHYLCSLLDKLVSRHGVEVHVIVPEKKGAAVGEGVRLSHPGEGHLFTVHSLAEYNGKLNKPYFRKLDNALESISPGILVMSWPHIVNYLFDRRSRRVVKKKNIALVFREIPFMVAPKGRAIGYYRKYPVVNENLEVENPRGVMFYPWAVVLDMLRKRYYRLADATMIYSSLGVGIQRSFGIPEKDIFVTYNSPDSSTLLGIRDVLLERGGVEEHAERIIHVGRLVKWKRVDLLIEAVSLLSGSHPGIELVIIGTGPEQARLEALSKEKEAAGRIRFLGGIYDAEVLAKELLSSAVYVLAGMGGLSLNEAMALGKPVICSRCDGTEVDLVEDGISGLYFKEGDASDLASKIASLLDDPEKRVRMGENALRVIREKINLETVVQRFMDCFNYVLSKKGTLRVS
jgi:glycosyltransferase involved in cell wall biosynthesis